jgi:hypothetical protein
LFVPTLFPFFFQWYTGVAPPFTGVAVKVTEVPAQTGFAEATMTTLTGNTGVTVVLTEAVPWQPVLVVTVTV